MPSGSLSGAVKHRGSHPNLAAATDVATAVGTVRDECGRGLLVTTLGW